MSQASSDERWMRRAFDLAQHGRWTTWPNPMVGCVVVKDDQTLGEGWHERHGEAHAEVNALRQIAPHVDLGRATAYVTLEPCSHHGKTPPCADLLIDRGIGTVVVGTQDPNPMVAGRGVARLREAGIEVRMGTLEQEAEGFYAKFAHAMLEPTPWVTLKWAQSSDGRLDPEHDPALARGGHPLTGRESGIHTHGLRACHDGILVGMRTLLIDLPSLTTRHVAGSNPRRFVVTQGHTAPPSRGQIAEGPWTLLCPFSATDTPAMKAWQSQGHEVIGMEENLFSHGWWSSFKAQTQVRACMVEGGARVAQAVLDSGCWNECHVLTAPHAIKQGLEAPAKPAGQPAHETTLGEDTLQTWVNPQPNGQPC